MDEKLLHADNRDGINLSDFCLLDDGCSSDGSAAGDCSDDDAVYLGARKVRVPEETETSAAQHETSFVGMHDK